MMKQLFVVLVLMMFSVQAEARDAWTKKDTAYQLTYTVLHIIDWQQTKYIARNPDKFYEMNPILGKHPSVGRVNTYFLLTGVAQAAIAYYLPRQVKIFSITIPVRRTWQVVWIGIQSGVVLHNFRVGIKIDF